MGLETIFLVFGLVIVVGVVVGLGRSRRAARKNNTHPQPKP